MIPADIRFPLERANGIQIIKTAAALAERADHVTLLVRQSDPRTTAEILALFGVSPSDRLEVARLAVGHRRGAVGVSRLGFLLKAGWRSWRALRHGGVVYTRDLQLAELLLHLPLRSGRLVYEAHAVEAVLYEERGRIYGTDEVPGASKTRRLARRERRVWRKADAFVATTRGIASAFQTRHGSRERIHVIPNGCDVASDTAPPLPQDDPPRIVYAGQLYPWKGVDVLIEAMKGVRAARLVVLGGLEGERDLARVRGLVESSGLADRIELRGHRPHAEVAAELLRARIVVVPFLESAMTIAHTSPIKAFEAMAAGRPIVASDLPSTREILRHEHDSLLVPPGRADALADAIQRLLDDAPLAERLASAAFSRARQHSWRARAGRLIEAMEAAA